MSGAQVAIAKPSGGVMSRMDVAREVQRLKTVRLRLAQQHPFWGFLLLHVRLIPADELTAFAATDCVRRIWFNPRFTRHLSLGQLAFVLCHEIGHMLFETAGRQHGRDPYLWNCATDYAINRVVARMLFTTKPFRMMPAPNGVFPDIGEVEILLDSRFDGMIAEVIYEHLLKEQPKRSGVVVRISLPDGSTDGPGNTDGNANAGGDEDTDGRGGTIEFEVDGHRLGGLDVHLPADLSQAELDELADRVTAAIDAHRQSERRGSLPGHTLRDLGLIRKSTVAWQRVLQRFAGECLTREQYSLRRPNRRFLALDMVVPGLVEQGPARLVVAVDTSASMPADVLAAAAAEIAALADLVRDVTVLVADAKVQSVIATHCLPAFLKERKFRGGGGTDHRPVFAWIDAQAEKPDLFIGLTDLWSAFPARKPDFPVLWVVPTNHGRAPWGQVVPAQ